MGATYYFLPRITGRQIWSLRLAETQYWLVSIGLIGFFLVLTTLGLIQGQAWLNGETVYRLLPEMSLYFVLRGMLGILVVLGALMFAFNVLMTFWKGKEVAA